MDHFPSREALKRSNLFEIEAPEAVADWAQIPHSAPRGGDSFTAVTIRIGGWMDGLLGKDGSILAITHAFVIRAAIVHELGAEPKIFRHIRPIS